MDNLDVVNGTLDEESLKVVSCGDERSRPSVPQIAVTEKVVFCIDSEVVDSRSIESSISSISNMVFQQMLVKQKSAINDIEFSILLVLNSSLMYHTHIMQKKDIHTALQPLKQKMISKEETFDLSSFFQKLASIVEMPDYSCYGESIPPPFVYHAVLLFSRSCMLTLNTTNGFDFLMDSPYFTLDVCYLYNKADGVHEIIEQLLKCLNVNGNGYLVSCDKAETFKIKFNCMSLLLGHPLIRVPQSKAIFDLDRLLPNIDEGDLIEL